jgi:DGQHR domain-containing protein
MTTYNVMTSPANTSLHLTLFKSKEQIENLGVTTYEGIATFGELADHTRIECNSDVLNEADKKQRDVDAARLKGLKTYWNESEGAVFPSMTLFASDLKISSTIEVGNKSLCTAELAAETDRFISDGQGRTSFIKWLMEQEGSEQFRDNTIAFKLIITHTKDLSDPKATRVAKQLFSDYHVSLKKPSKSISKYFDTSTPFARFVDELLEIDTAKGVIKPRIALNGKIKQGQLWTYEQFTSMIQKFLKVTPATANKDLVCGDKYAQLLELCTQFLQQLFSVLPLEALDCENSIQLHEKAMFTKAIFANAMGFVGRSIVDEMLIDEGLTTWDKLVAIDAPLLDKDDKFWTKNKVTSNDGGKIKIIRGTDVRIGSVYCHTLRIFPCADLSA